MKESKAPIRIAQIMGKMVGGGVESVVMNYYHHMAKEKFRFDFLVDCDSTNIPYKEIESLGGRVILIPPYQNLPKYLKELKKIFQENQYKIVHSHINTLSVFPLYVAKKCKIPVRIAHSHSTSNKKEYKKNLLKNLLRPFSKRYATHYFCCSEYAGRYLFGNKAYDKQEVTLMNNAIAIDKFLYNEEIRKNKRKELGITNELVIGHVGRFISQKNHIRLLEIFHTLTITNNNIDSILLLVGEGSLEPKVKEKVKELNLEKKVKFLGQRTDVNELMQAMDIFLLPSLYEGLPVVGVEAQTAGLLCILSSEMTKETKVLSTTKFISLKNSNEEWVREILTCYQNFQRQNTKNEIIKANFEIATEAKKLEKRYQTLLKQPKKKIFFIVNTNIYSGAEAVNINIINHLKNKYDFYWVSKKGPIDDYLSMYHIKHIEIEKVNRKEIKRIIKEYKPDILHATDYRASVISSLCTRKIPVISHLHNNSPWLKNPIHPNSLAYLYAGIKSNAILTVSDSIEEEYTYSNLISKKITNISNPISRKEILSKVEKKEDKQYDICFVGRLTEQKDPLRFIELISKLKKQKKNIKAIMVGEGELREQCEQKIKELSLSRNIKMVGFQKNPYTYMNQSKVFLLPSKWEGFGLVVFEALTLGLPCFTTKVGGMVNLVTETCGSFCQTDEDFVDKIIPLLTEEKKYQTLSKEAIKRSKELDNSKFYYENIDKIYQEV